MQLPCCTDVVNVNKITFTRVVMCFTPDEVKKCNSHWSCLFLRSKRTICVCCGASKTNHTIASQKRKIAMRIEFFRSVWI